MNRYYPHTIIAQEGWSFILGGLAASVFFSFLWGWWSLPFWIFTLFCVNFFRDPARNIPEAPDAVISPADGRIVVVERALDPYRQTEALKISVFMNVFDVHSQRAPVSGVVTEVKYTAGKFLNASLDKSSTENERNAVLMTTRTGRELTFVQVAGLVARRVLCYTNKGDNLVRGERYGFIRFGSRVDVYLPLDAKANVAIGDKVRASETILAYLPLEKSDAVNDLAAPASSQSVAETRLKADIQSSPVAEPQFQAAPKAETTTQFTVASMVEPSLLDEARLAAATEQLKAEAEAAKQAAEQAKIQAEAEIAKLKAEAEQAKAQVEQAKAQAEAEVARLKAEAEAAQLKAQQEAQAAKLQAEQEAQAAAQAKAQAEAAQLRAQQEAEAAKLQAEQEAQAAAQAKAQAEAAQLRAQQEAEAARLKAEQEAQAAAQAKAEAEAAQLKAQQEAEAAKLKAEQEAQAAAQAKAEAEAAQLKAQQEAEAARLKAEQEAQAKAQAEAEAAKLKAEQEAQAKAAEAKARAEAVAKAQAEEKAKEEAIARAKAEAEAKLKAEQAAKLKAEQEAKARAKAEQSAKAKAEAEALAEIAARKPIVRREVFAAVPEPWQTIEPREVIIRTEVVDKK